MKAFLFGAGCSRGSIGAPIAAEFGREFNKLAPGWCSSGCYSQLALVVDHLRLPRNDWALEPVWSCMDYYAKFGKEILDGIPWAGESPQLKKALLRVYGKQCDSRAEALPVTDAFTLGRLLKHEVNPGDLMISFNYDTVVERLALKFGHNLRSASANGLSGNAVNLAKPHGSTSWTLDLSNDQYRAVTSSSPDGLPLLDSLTENDVDQKREPLVLGAVPIKSELIRELQEERNSPQVFDTIAKQWNAVVHALRDAESLVLVGYSIPKEDQYGRFVFQEGIRLRGNRTIDVEYFELDANAGDRAKDIMDALNGKVAGLDFRGPVTSPRVPEMHAGNAWTSDDFDAPLSEAFGISTP